MYEESDTVALTIKNYSVGGLSETFYNSDREYTIKGPMGKGLGLNMGSRGVHYAFAAGTGVLVFVDLVARILLGARGLLKGAESLDPAFKLVLYASFNS